MVEVFKTNVEEVAVAEQIVQLLLQHFPGARINFDLEDCDRILRVEGPSLTAVQIIRVTGSRGVVCIPLE